MKSQLLFTFLSLLLLSSSMLSAQENDDPFYYAEQQRVRVECSIYRSQTVEANAALKTGSPNSFNALLSSYMQERFVNNKSLDKKLQLIKYFDANGDLVKIEARSFFSGIGKEKQRLEMRVLSTYYYLPQDNRLLVHQMASMNGAEMENSFDTGWTLYEASTGDVIAMVINEEVQDEVALEREDNQRTARVSYIGALLFKELN